MQPDVTAYHASLSAEDRRLCERLYALLEKGLPEAEIKVWHAHPVWFLDGNPVAGYSKQKAGIRLMFWSGADFGDERLRIGTGKFRDASFFYQSDDDIHDKDLLEWSAKARDIQWDYQHIVKRKGELIRLK